MAIDFLEEEQKSPALDFQEEEASHPRESFNNNFLGEEARVIPKRPSTTEGGGRVPLASAGELAASFQPDVSEMGERLFQPAIELPRLYANNPVTRTVLASQLPIVPPELTAAAANTGMGFIESATSPIGAATLPLTAVKSLQPALKGIFGGLMAKSAGEQAGQASVTKDPQQILEAALTAAAAGATAFPEFGIQPERTPNASTITSTEGLPQSEVRTPVGEEARVRQSGQTAGTQVKTEVSPPPAEQVRAEVTPDIVQFGQDFAAGKKISTEAAVGVGLKAKSIADLEALMEIQAKFKEEVAQARQRVKSATTPAEQQAALQEAVIKGTSAQLPREAIEGAVNAGSNAERGNIKFGERPLDWRKHPEVAEWLKKNGEKIGIKLPDELKSSPTTQPAAAPEAAKPPPAPAAAPVVEAGKAKQPWEMTKEEYVGEYNEPYSVKDIQEASKKAISARKRHNARTGAMVPPAISGEISAKISRQESTAEGMRQAYRAYVDAYKNGIEKHYESIKNAIREGKPVPPEVLKDYPDLQQPPEIIGMGGAKLGETSNEPSLETQGAIAASTPLTPSTTTTTLTPKSQRQIITDLAKGLNLPIRFGRLTTSKFAGYFKPRANLIGSKRAVDVPTVSHEAGHKLDDTLKLSSDKSIASELDVLGDPATPGSGSSWTPSKTKKYKMGEGVAEFVRYWLTDPAKALKDAPNTHAAFEAMLNANKDFGDVMRQAQEDIKTWRESEPQARLRSHISTDNPNKTRYTLSQLTRDLVDDLHILRLAVDEAKKSGDLPPSKDPYLAARNLRGSYGMADTFIRNGVADFNTKEVKLGTSLEDALKPIAGRLSDFRDWIVAKRAQELRGQGKETGLIASDVDTVVKKFQNDAAFQKAFDDIKTWNDSTLQYAVDAGLITPESAAAMRKMNLDYVPFSRLFEVGAGEAPSQQSMGVGTGLNVGKPGSFKRLTGSTREIVDPIETMIKNAYTIITASEKAAINRSVAEMSNLPNMGKWVERIATPKEGVRFDLERVKKQLEDAGADLTNVPDDLILSFFRQSGRAPFGENIIRVIRNGKPEFYRLNRDLHDTFQALDLEDSGKLVRILSAPAQLLRAGVVLEPSFNVANALRDTFSAAVISKYGALPFETTLKGVAAMIKNPQAVAEWAAAGGKNSVEANFFDRTKMQKFLTEKIAKDLTPAERALVVTKSPLTALRWLTSKAEEATRIGEYQIAYKKLIDSGMPEGDARRLAAFESRDRQDFAKGGAKTKIIRHMSAFWNASLQANVKLAQAFKERPGKTLLAGLAFVTIPKLLEQAVNWDDKDYWDRPQWERDMFFMIPVGKDETNHTKFLRIPTPFEVGLIFGTFPGRLLQWLKTNKPESVSGFPQMMLKQSVPNPIPQTLQVTFEDFLSGEKGWDIWRGRTVVPESLADLPADLQWTDQTSGLAKRVGQALNYSPMKVDHIIERTTGGLGKLATGKQYPGQRFMAAPLRISNEPLNDFYEQLGELRKQNAASKLDKQIHKPAHLAQFEKTARELSELRDKARKAQTDAQKAVIQEQIFQKAKGQVEKYGNNP